jgi:hypothetical protein
MATGRTSQPVGERLDSLPSLPPGVIPQPRAQADPPLPPSESRRRNKVLLVAVPAVVAIGVGAAVLGLTSQSTPTGVAAPVAPKSAEDFGFLKTVRQQAGFAALSDDSMVKIGHMLCTRLQSGANPDDIAMGSASASFSVEDVSTAVGAAAGAYCPDQITRVGQPG